jgi:hypothetical protein
MVNWMQNKIKDGDERVLSSDIPPFPQGVNPARWYALYPPARFEIRRKPCIIKMLAAMLARWPPLHMTI